MTQQRVEVATIISRDFQENTFVVWLSGRDDCAVIDPGLEPDRIEQYLGTHGLTPAAILNTHGHADHIGGNAALKRRWPNCPLVIGRGDASMLTDAVENLSAPFGFSVVSPPADVLLDDGDRYTTAGIDFEVLAIPGHTPGHVVYIFRGENGCLAFVGDVIFAGSVGRTDFPGGDYRALISGIHGKLFTLPDSTLLYPGHGPSTSVGYE
ncbi:MAG: MBL fold metallo-hydrolase, partial [Thermoguttaceae bacterium]|nr:MBL fold metallo-hydrolase [Thermoguttaceae bacterium]